MSVNYPVQQFPPQPKNGFGTAGFVLGLVGAVFALIPIIGIVAWFLVIPGLILALIGLARALSGTANNKGMSIAGVALSVIGLVICFAYAATFAAAFSGSTALASPPLGHATVPSSVTSAGTTPAGALTDGTYMVGSEIQPGSYHTSGPASDSIMHACTWSRNKDTSGEFTSIIANHVSSGPDTLTVQSTDAAVEFAGGCAWTKVN